MSLDYFPDHVREWYRREVNDMGEEQNGNPERQRMGGLETSVRCALHLIERARDGDTWARKQVLFPFRYGHVRDKKTGEFRSYTPEEISEIEKRLIG